MGKAVMDEEEMMAYLASELGEDGASAIVQAAVEESRYVSMDEVARHNTPDDCWVILHGNVYNLTEFAKRHLGGMELITRLAGKDGTEAFSRVHGESILSGLDTRFKLGLLRCEAELLQTSASTPSEAVTTPLSPTVPPLPVQRKPTPPAKPV